MEPFDRSDVHRWKKIPDIPKATRAILERYPVFADRALHEIERLWTPEFADLPRKKKISTYDGVWLNQYSSLHRTTAIALANAYCDMRERNNAVE